MDINEVKQWIKDNQNQPEVASYITGLVTSDRVQVFLETEEGKRFMQPKMDQYFTKGLETWKTNNLEKLVNDRITEQNPGETEQDKRIKALELSLATAEKARTKQETRAKAILKLTEKKYPLGLVDLISADNDTELNGKLETLNSNLEQYAKELIEGKYKEQGRIPNKPNFDKGTKNPWSKEDWNLTEQGKLLKSNPDLAKYFRENTRSK